MATIHKVVVYSRKGCHLCDEVKATLARLGARPGSTFTWTEVDIDTDPELQRKFNDEVPVVFVDGKKAFKYRMAAADFLRLLEARE